MWRKYVVLLVATLALAGCAAGGPTLAQKPDALPPLAPGKGRLFIYRDVQAGGVNVDTVRPELLVGGDNIGRAVAGGVYVRDLPPGNYRVELKPPSLGDMFMSGNYQVGYGATVVLREGQEEFVKVRATNFSMNCTIGCAATTIFAVEAVLSSTARPEALQRVLQQVSSKD